MVSFIGMRTQEVAIKSKLSIVLGPDAEILDEVVVTAFGTSKKGTFTGSAGTMKAEKLEQRQVSNVSQALSGAVAGVQIQSSNGQPGESATVRVRGVGSINAGSTPLYVVDGVPFDGDLSSINTADIESLTVLKDAASTALYGARGANGIIMITTKKGKMGKATVNFDAKWGANSRGVKNYDVLTSTAEYLEREYQAIYNTGFYDLGYDAAAANAYANQIITTNEEGGNGYQIYTLPQGQSLIGMDGKLNPSATLGYSDGKHYFTPDNWSDIMFKNTLRQEYNMSISGSTERNNFYASIGYLEDNGLVSGSGFERYTGRVRDDYQVNKWLKVGMNAAYTYSKSFYPGDQTSSGSSGNAFMMANWIAPIYPMYVRDAQGNIMLNKGREVFDYGTVDDAGYKRSFMSISNPAGQLMYDKTEYLMDILSANWYAEVTPIKGLVLSARYGLNIDNTRYHYLQNAFMGQFAEMGGAAGQYHMRTYGFNQQYAVNYQFTLNDKHNFDVAAIYDGYTYHYEQVSASGSCLYNPESFYVSNTINSKNGGGYANERASIGYIGRINYNYADKYIANVAFRRDGSSRFSPDNRWGNFWSASAAWVMSEEEFMQDVKWVDMLKLKASFGQQGNDNIGNNYAWLDQYAMTGSNSIFSDGSLSYKGNPDLTWETSTSYNVGFDFALFDSRLNGTIEYFGRKSTDMLYYKPVAGSLGYTQIPMNVGSMTNSGLEVDFSYDIIRNKNIKWNVNANATFIKNTINELHPDLKGQLIDGSRIYEEGESMYRMYLPEWAGVNPENGVAQYWAEDADGNRIKTEDLQIANQYKVATDDLLPTVYGGIGTSISAFGFDASIQMAYQLGGTIYDSGYASLMHNGYSSSAGRNWHTDIRNAWTPENKNTDIPRLSASDRYASSTSTRFLTSSDYLSINNITVGYTFPSNWVSKIGLTKLRVYFSGDNLGMLTARKGLDPRQSFTSASTATYTAMRTVSGGISLSF
ncbi:MAG: TonB-dependent receptor [Bacteroides sp.]|nr:TonB-dependent receptor [Bacteroides sp.]